MSRIATLVPVNEELKNKFLATLKKNFGFTDADMFINMVNSKVFDMKNSIVKDTYDELFNSYKNINQINNRIVIDSNTELAVKNSIKLLMDWEILIKLKRLATFLVDEEYNPDTKIVFNEDSNGKPLIEVIDAENKAELVSHWASEKIVKNHSEFANNIFTSHFVRDYEDNACYFLIEDLIDIDDSFLVDIEKMLLKNSFADKKDKAQPQNQNQQNQNKPQ